MMASHCFGSLRWYKILRGALKTNAAASGCCRGAELKYPAKPPNG